jgi:hypothetical protein
MREIRLIVMPSLEYPKLLALAVVIVTLIFWPPKNRSFTRRGLDPGFLGLKVWPARIWFLLRGRDIVEQAYLKVDAADSFTDFHTHYNAFRKRTNHIFCRVLVRILWYYRRNTFRSFECSLVASSVLRKR